MPKKDISRRAVEIVAERIDRAAQLFADMVPMGPTKVGYSPSEFQQRAKKLDPQELAGLIDQVGEEEIMRILQERKNGATTGSNPTG